MIQEQNMALVPGTGDMNALVHLGRVLAASGFFEDARKEAQAVVKVLAGQEVGIPPIAAMTGIHVIKGKISIGANIMAGLVKKSPRYDYKVIRLDAQVCQLQFLENGKPVGESSYTLEEAKQADLFKPGGNWAKFPKNMLFARAVSNGTRLYCPDLLGGAPVYTPDELGAQVDEYGEVIEGEVTVLDDADTPPGATRTAPAPRRERRAPNTPPAPETTPTPQEADTEERIAATVQARMEDAAGKMASSEQWRTLARLYLDADGNPAKTKRQLMALMYGGERTGEWVPGPEALTSDQALDFIAAAEGE